MHLADEVRWHLAGAEAGHPHLRRHALHFLIDPRLDVLGGDGQHEGALQALFFGLDGLDGHGSKVLMILASAAPGGAGGGTRTPTVSHLDLNQARLPISPRPRRTPERMGAYSNHGRWSNPARAEIVGWQRRICRAAASDPGNAPAGAAGAAKPARPAHSRPARGAGRKSEYRRPLAAFAGNPADDSDLAGRLDAPELGRGDQRLIIRQRGVPIMRARRVDQDQVQLAADHRANRPAAPPQLVVVEMLIIELETVGAEERADALNALREDGADPDLAAACAFARRRRLGPFRRDPAIPLDRDRVLAAFARAGFARREAEAVLACADPDAVAALLAPE